MKTPYKGLLAGGALLLALFLGCETEAPRHQPAVQQRPETASASTPRSRPPAPPPPMPRAQESPVLPDLQTTTQRQDYYEQLLEEDSASLWAQWQRYLDSDDANASMAWLLLGEALSLRLREQPDPATLNAIASALDASDASAALLEQLPMILARAATPEALELLLAKVSTETDREQRRRYQEAIETATNTQWDARFHPELSPPLENAWSEQWPRQDAATLNTLATAIARVGADSGVNLLLDTLASAGEDLADLEIRQLPPQIPASARALANIRNPAAVPLLSRHLARFRPEDPVFLASGNALANIGGPAATQALLDWARTAPDAAQPLARRWFGRVRDNRSIELTQATLDSGASFASQPIRQTVQQALEQARGGLEAQLRR